MVLVERQLAGVLAVGVGEEHVGHRVAAADARHAVEAPRRAEHDPPVGQVAGVVVVHVGVRAGRDLAEALAVDADLEDLPAVLRAGRAEEHAIAVEVQVDVADESAAVGLVQPRQLAVRPNGREHGDLIVVLVARQGTVALPVLRQAEVPATLDHQQLVEVQQRVGQQGLLTQRDELLRHVRTTAALLQRLQTPEVLRALGVLRTERLGQVLDGHSKRANVRALRLRLPPPLPLGRHRRRACRRQDTTADQDATGRLQHGRSSQDGLKPAQPLLPRAHTFIVAPIPAGESILSIIGENPFPNKPY